MLENQSLKFSTVDTFIHHVDTIEVGDVESRDQPNKHFVRKIIIHFATGHRHMFTMFADDPRDLIMARSET